MPPRPVLPANLPQLFPEHGGRLRAIAAPSGEGVVLRGNGQRLLVAQDVLAAPPFHESPVWTSARILQPAQPEPNAAPDSARGAALLAAIAAARVGGSFWAPAAPALPRGGLVLAVLPGQDTARALTALLARHAAQRLVLLAPVPTGLPGGITVLHAPADPWTLLDQADQVYAPPGHPLGLLALAAERALAWLCAGRLVPETDAATRAAHWLLAGARHANPFQPGTCAPEQVIELLAEWRRLGRQAAGVASVIGIAWWKRRNLRALLDTGGAPPFFTASAAKAVAAARSRGGAVLAWPSTRPRELTALAAAAGVPVWQVEDGFLRSAGLGVHGVPPGSVVVDAHGIYFDPASPSGLERILAETDFPPALLDRAAALVTRTVASRVSKYNVGRSARLQVPAGRRIILVPGQVGDDRSVLLAGGDIGGNAGLLRRVREEQPDAFIIYKPHPDVTAGHRAGALHVGTVRRHADMVVTDIALPALLEQVDELHTLTSLAGFEALLRGTPVVVHGSPFYAGWGLTEDRQAHPRRTRRLSLLELVAGTLILYPRYIDPLTRLPCPPEVFLARLATRRRAALVPILRRAYGSARRLARLLHAQ